MYRTKEYRMDQRQKAITRKKKIFVEVWGDKLDWLPNLGMLDKAHIGCGCGICKPTKRFGYPSGKDLKRQQILLDKNAEFAGEYDF